MLLTAAIWLGSSFFAIRDHRLDQRQDALRFAAFLTERTARMGLWTELESLRGFLGDLQRTHGTIAYAIVEHDQNIVIAVGEENIPESVLGTGEIAQAEGTVTQHRGQDGVVLIDVAIPVEPPGHVFHVGSKQGSIDEHTAGILKSIAIGSTLATLLGFVLAWTIAVMTTREVSQAETALRESEERFRILFEQAPDSLMLMSLDDPTSPMIIEANEATCRSHGYTRDEIIGMPIAELDAPGDRQHVPSRGLRILAGEVVSFEAEHVRKDGSTFPVEVIARLIEINGRPVIQAIDRDISERRAAEEQQKSLEAQLHQAQKMQAIGRLAGGIAHDMNNILGAIMGAASVLDEKLKPDDPSRDEIEKILQAGRRGRDFTRNFLGYARKGSYHKENINLNELAEDTIGLLGHTLPKQVDVRLRKTADLPPAHGDRSLLGQVLVNICINAADAMKGRGTLTLETKTIRMSPDEAEFRSLKPGVFVVVGISDTGEGMDEATIAQAFEPFFTTKPEGQGTGLGLAMAYGTLRAHSGDVFITSRPGSGTTVTLLLPASEKATADPRPSPVEPAPAETVTQATILLVEDEQLLRWAGQQMLERIGHTVIPAANGREGVDIYRSRGDSIDLVVLDLVMPEMNGREAFKAIREYDPSARILISSGFSSDETVEDLLASGADGFIEKPYEAEDLRRKVASLLGDR